MRGALPLFLLLTAVGWFAAVGGCGRAPPAPRPTGEVALEQWQGFAVHDPERIPSDLATNPGTPWGDYMGSRACERCHAALYAQWRHSFHSRTLYDAVEPTIFGDFSGEHVFDEGDYPFVVLPFRERDPETGAWRHYMKIRWRSAAEGWPEERRRRKADSYGNGVPDLAQGTYEVLYAFGNRRHQPYIARWPDGKYWVLPVFWNDVEKAWRYDGFRPYVESCGSCHVTGIRRQDTPAPDNLRELPHTSPVRYNVPRAEEGWADGAVGCEVCHGPGRKHVEAVDRVGVARYADMRAQEQKGPSIYDGRSEDFERQLDQCGQCHNFFTESTVTWVPGPQGFERDALRALIRPRAGNDFQFYADGSHKSPCTVVEVYRSSKMHHEGIGCGACHDPHGTDNWADLRLPIEDNALCLACHVKTFPDVAAQTAHSKHAAGSPGNRCVECHMPRHMVFTNGVQMMSDRIFSHEFSVPTGEQAPGGPPPSCNVCHVDRDAAWTRERIREMWGAPEDAGEVGATGATGPDGR